MEKTMTLNLRVNPTVKQQAEDVLKQHGISSVLTTPENLSVDVINKYLEMKSRSQI